MDSNSHVPFNNREGWESHVCITVRDWDTSDIHMPHAQQTNHKICCMGRNDELRGLPFSRCCVHVVLQRDQY